MDLKVRGTDDEMESQSEDQCWLCVSLGCTKAQSVLPRSCTLPAALGLGGRGGGRSRPEGGIWNLPQVGSGTAQKTLSRKTVTKCHDFHSSWKSAEFWDSQHEFLSSSDSK